MSGARTILMDVEATVGHGSGVTSGAPLLVTKLSSGLNFSHRFRGGELVITKATTGTVVLTVTVTIGTAVTLRYTINVDATNSDTQVFRFGPPPGCTINAGKNQAIVFLATPDANSVDSIDVVLYTENSSN